MATQAHAHSTLHQFDSAYLNEEGAVSSPPAHQPTLTLTHPHTLHPHPQVTKLNAISILSGLAVVLVNWLVTLAVRKVRPGCGTCRIHPASAWMRLQWGVRERSRWRAETAAWSALP